VKEWIMTMTRTDMLQPVLWLFALAATITISFSALAQADPPGTPPRPFQERSSAPVPLPPGATTPQTRSDAIEAWAKNWKEKRARPAARETHYAILHARDVAEFDALGRYSLLILSAMTQRAEELPLKRVYLRMPDREVPLVKIASWRTEVDPTMVSYKMFGPYREDGFYLFPLSAYLRVAQLQADFAANRMSLPVLELPYSGGPEWLRTLQNPDPLPGALPDLSVLQEFIKRATPGFPIPSSVPGTTEARRPSPEAVAQPGELKKPASLTDLFKK
jgi:hypothetical protein